MYRPLDYTAAMEQRGQLTGMLQYIVKDNERLAALDRQNELDLKTMEKDKGLRGGFQVLRASGRCIWHLRRLCCNLCATVAPCVIVGARSRVFVHHWYCRGQEGHSVGV